MKIAFTILLLCIFVCFKTQAQYGFIHITYYGAYKIEKDVHIVFDYQCAFDYQSITPTKIKLQYRYDTLKKWVTIDSTIKPFPDSSIVNTYSFNIPTNVLPGSRIWIRLIDSTGKITDSIKNYITILKPAPIDIVYPRLDTPESQGNYLLISFSTDAKSIEKVNIYYAPVSYGILSGPWHFIRSYAPDKYNPAGWHGSFYWYQELAPGDYCMKFADAADSTLCDSALFEILPVSKFIRLWRPSGGESLAPNSIFNIVWLEGFIRAANVYFSADSGKTYTEICRNDTVADFQWLIPDTFSNNCFIKVVDTTSGAQLLDSNKIAFKITGTQPVLTPLSKQEFHIGINPNPARGAIAVQAYFTDPGSIELFSTLGKEIYKKEINITGQELKLNIEIPELSNGIYFLKARSGKNSNTQKFYYITQ